MHGRGTRRLWREELQAAVQKRLTISQICWVSTAQHVASFFSGPLLTADSVQALTSRPSKGASAILCDLYEACRSPLCSHQNVKTRSQNQD